MAEALALVSVVASIVQLVDFSAKVLIRLNEFQANLGEIPKSFRHLKVELPLLEKVLQQTQQAIEAGSIGDDIARALCPVIDSCTGEIKLLDSILAKITPETTDSWSKRKKKVVSSLVQDSKVETITKTIRGYIQTLTFYYAAASSTLNPLTGTKSVKILNWLSPPDPSSNYQKALKLRQAGTGLWFLNSDAYAKWKVEPASLLWLHGIPGCGKTILSSTILQDLLECCAKDPGKPVVYFYFDFNSERKQDPELMVRSLIAQLLQRCITVPPALETLFSSCDEGHRQPFQDSLLEVLRAMLQQFPSSYVVVDALDECQHRMALMDFIEQIAGWQLENVHFLVTSRKEYDIQSSLDNIISESAVVCLQSQLVNQDISKYVCQRLNEDKSLKKWQKDQELRQEIETTMMEGSHGMFRWVVCQLDALAKCLSRAMLRKALANLPSTLDATYERILCTIDPDLRNYALRTLNWLAFSFRPISVEEIAEVVAINVDCDPAFNRDEVLEDPLEVLKICSSLITINTPEVLVLSELEVDGLCWEESEPEELDAAETSSACEGLTRPRKEIVQLAHYSVKEYLVSDRISRGPASHYSMQGATGNELLAQSCVGYLLQFHQPVLSQQMIRYHKLVEYAAEFWMQHAKATEPATEKLDDLIMKLFLADNRAYRNWTRIYDPAYNYGLWHEASKNAPGPLYYAASAGLVEISKLLILSSKVDVNLEGGYYGTALQAASYQGHDQVVELLISSGANIDTPSGYHSRALQLASHKGHVKVVELLIRVGANLNVSQPSLGTALGAALAQGHETIVELLVRNGACSYFALAKASCDGHERIVELLIRSGADVNSQKKHFCSALAAAASYGHKRIVELLIRSGADVDARGDRNSTALVRASYRGHESIVELLIRSGAEVNGRGTHFGLATNVAAFQGHERIVELLVRSGADVNALGPQSTSALAEASSQGHERIVELLIKSGADVNLSDGTRSALFTASKRGYERIVELLLRSGADINPSDGTSTHSALWMASRQGYERIVELLIRSGADVNPPDGSYSALWAASRGGHERIVELLLDHGAEINGVTPKGTALTVASLNGWTKMVELLLNRGAEIDDSVLQAAMIYNVPHAQVIELLLDRGADINAVTPKGTALTVASSKGWTKMVKLLLSRGAKT